MAEFGRDGTTVRLNNTALETNRLIPVGIAALRARIATDADLLAKAGTLTPTAASGGTAPPASIAYNLCRAAPYGTRYTVNLPAMGSREPATWGRASSPL